MATLQNSKFTSELPNLQIDKMAVQLKGTLMKQKVDETTYWKSWLFAQWQVCQIMSWQNVKLTKCKVDKMTSWQNGKLTK